MLSTWAGSGDAAVVRRKRGSTYLIVCFMVMVLDLTAAEIIQGYDKLLGSIRRLFNPWFRLRLKFWFVLALGQRSWQLGDGLGVFSHRCAAHQSDGSQIDKLSGLDLHLSLDRHVTFE